MIDNIFDELEKKFPIDKLIGDLYLYLEVDSNEIVEIVSTDIFTGEEIKHLLHPEDLKVISSIRICKNYQNRILYIPMIVELKILEKNTTSDEDKLKFISELLYNENLELFSIDFTHGEFN